MALSNVRLLWHLRGTLLGSARPQSTPVSGDRRTWTQRHRASLLLCVLLCCVTLLAACTGASATPTGGASPSTSSTTFDKTQQAGGDTITLKVTPAKFGSNTFTVTVQSAQQRPVTNAKVLLENTMVEMNMGVESAQLVSHSSLPPGTYTGQGELTMAGHWNILVKVLPPQVSQFISTTFIIPVTY